jgi:hypothetical protein
MIFTFEALRAKHGDSLLLHYGRSNGTKLIVIDGGPAGVFDSALRPRLQALKEESGADPLPIRLLMVSHIDDDHIRGVLDLTNRLRRQQENNKPVEYDIRTLWHNSFDDIVGHGSELMATTARAGLSAAALAGEVDPPPGLSRPAMLVLASVPQGRELRNNARVLGIEVNPPQGQLITGMHPGDPPMDRDDGLTLRAVGPSRQRLRDLQTKWDAELQRRQLASPVTGVEAAAYADQAVTNLSSLVVLAEMDAGTAGKRRILLTGDSRGDDILEGLAEAGLLEGDRLHVDVLKVPHHGSDRNVTSDFFRRLTADHYVISGDGKYGNPDVATFEMIFAARGNDRFTLHMTYDPAELIDGYPVDDLRALFEHHRSAGHPFELVTAKVERETVRIDLGAGVQREARSPLS